jgi:hypothetical protein
MRAGNQQYEMELGDAIVNVGFDWTTYRLWLAIYRPTQFNNIFYCRWITLGHRWPWLRNISGYRDEADPENS